MTLFARCLRSTAIGCLAVLSAVSCAPVASEVGDEDVWSGEEEIIAGNPLTGIMPEGATLRTTNDLNLRAGPGKSFDTLVAIPEGANVILLRMEPEDGFYNVIYGSVTGWASGMYLEEEWSLPWPGDTPPPPGEAKPVRINGPSVRAHVQNFANVACGTFGCPHTIGTYGGHQPSADRAIDMMMSPGGKLPADGGAHGGKIADFAVANAKAHRIDYVIWRQRINMGDGRGWRGMENRGSITQNHFDHVHVSFDP